MASSRSAKNKRKTTHTKVKVGLRKKRTASKKPVETLLPGTAEPCGWATDASHATNYSSLGLSGNASGKTGRAHGVRASAREASTGDVQGSASLGAQALQNADADLLRVAMGKHLPAGVKPPRALYSEKQRRVVAALVERFGSDVEAMARDTKLNPLQHTASTLRAMIARSKVV